MKYRKTTSKERAGVIFFTSKIIGTTQTKLFELPTSFYHNKATLTKEQFKAAAKRFYRILVDIPNGPDLLTRFYNIETGKPLWVDRGGIIVKNHIYISHEQRNKHTHNKQFAHILLHDYFP